ncbi:MAG: general secretion pathway protein GspB [Chromatiaceae bacterium]|jgi:general secretion pathway protein B|nr:general secretion pathway protein GspB [Chromatiaceae bacterium]
MSYILEALRKSQQERELGHVPTLETPTLLAEVQGSRPNPWILLAVALAALAVVIALYSALRGGSPVGGPVETVAQTTRAAALETAEQDPTTPADMTNQPPTKPVFPKPAPVASGPLTPASGPPMKYPIDPGTAASSAVIEAPATSSIPETQRPTRVPPSTAEEPSSAQTRDRHGKVPPDLVADIEAFKRELRDEQSSASETAQGESHARPQDLRLPNEVRMRLPKFVMSAHIYDSEPSKRFVLINGLKTREGEESLQAIAVEQILPDGAVLSFDGHRFFQQR